jgi:mRNA interferase MazF
MDLEPGDLVLVPFPFTDLTAQKQRPALVVSSAEFHGAGKDAVLLAITSNVRDAAYSVLITPTDLDSGTLPKPSRVKVGKIVSLDRTIIRRRIGQLKRPVLDQVYRELRGVFPDLEF